MHGAASLFHGRQLLLRQWLFRLYAELFQAFVDRLPLTFHNLVEADHLYGCHTHEARQAIAHGLVERGSRSHGPDSL
jgi:hypothetical protein